ncbi:MAG: aminotransferase class III-fold pyridoxal phosphate-dependent enzyme [Deltaproteobacteria bacterium]|nr:aminotransferase class III-fold pyridoxal phosphate-dependent enzyme [Deltaproteobacteria bacterium]
MPGFSSVAAVLFEAVQGEGGIQCLTPEFAGVLATVAREHSAPLVADEIQCGLFRTGSFLAAHALGVKPDYVLLGKSLGGGLAKISALLVATERYNEKFGFVHTSTFAEDELSSRVALKTLEVLERDAGRIRESGARFEQAIREGVAAIQKKYPGVLNGSRGRGFLVGVEFNFTDSSEIPTIIHTIHQAGFAGYIYTSFLLNRHGIRVGVTLSRPDTLRLEPSALIQPESVARFLEALEDLCRLIHARKLVDLTRHFWNQEFTPRVLDTVSPVRYPAVRSREKLRKVGFLCHLIDDLHVKLMDPFLRNIGEEARNRFQTKLGAIAGPVLFHEQLVEGAGGKQIHLHCYGVYLQSKFFEKSHRAGDGLAMQQVTSMAERAARDGMDFVGLGQYTSIVSRNGLLLRRTGLNLTTGNGLTAGYAYQALVQAARDTGRELSELRIGVVGAAGNICCALTQVIADKAREVLLVFREGTEESQRAKDTHKAIVMGSSIDPARLSSSGRIADLKDCDVVVMGTSSAESVLFPEHLKENAIVLDVSVPSNIDERVYKERPDVKCYHGGRAKLPLGQNLRSDWLPAPVGETYACLGETICGGLVGHAGHLSYGVLTKATVLRTLELAKQVGMEMGTLRRVTRA